MQRAFDQAALQPALGQGGVLVAAGVVDRVEVAGVGAEDGDGGLVSTRTDSPSGRSSRRQTAIMGSPLCTDTRR
ncbi:hypothetical protein AUW26_03950 [Streptomyces sp. CC71]|nr:hypothetical protein AUW26_03950 [Streptomyces sp. CC71]